MYPSQYWRESKKWASLIGQKGKVLAVTTVHTPPPEYEQYSPYNLALVEFSNFRKLLPVPPAYELSMGQTVEVVLRKGGTTSDDEIIAYQLKVIPA